MTFRMFAGKQAAVFSPVYLVFACNIHVHFTALIRHGVEFLKRETTKPSKKMKTSEPPPNKTLGVRWIKTKHFPFDLLLITETSLCGKSDPKASLHLKYSKSGGKPGVGIDKCSNSLFLNISIDC